ncbi:MAG: hypothetical protein ABSE51_07955 [Terracidiphilus sp.]
MRPVPKSSTKDSRNDERELHQRDHAHYQAYRTLIVGLAVLWLMSIGMLLGPKPHPPAFGPIPANMILYGFVMTLLVVSLTLPQAILLWTEPDMEEEQG